MSDLIAQASLNPSQHEAVTLGANQNAIVLAGAGSGKTRVLIYRIAYLITEHQIPYHQILAVTFTNKAAREMRERLEKVTGFNTSGMWLGTFHHIAHRLLRIHHLEAGLDQNFTIIDSEDQLRLVRSIMKELHIDDKEYPVRKAQYFINQQKEEAKRSSHVTLEKSKDEVWLKVYQMYEEKCRQGSLVDFSELLLRAYEVWTQNPEILRHYQHRFSHILVDEFQDTNKIQYLWLKCLRQDNHFMVVGDDDQSIYGWRGAKIENLHKFAEEFPPTTLVRLEQNYRSTKVILQAANAVINHNNQRMGKSLWTDSEAGEPIHLYASFNELAEAEFIARRIETYRAQGTTLKDIAILYRSNAQSRVLEDNLLKLSIPYRIYGGMRFFERAEIKDAMAYLRLLIARQDGPSFMRIINTPTRGIGDKTIQAIAQHAAVGQKSLWDSAEDILHTKALPNRAHNALQNFYDLIEKLASNIDGLTLEEQVKHVVENSGLIEHYQKEPGQKGKIRLENLAELTTAAQQFIPLEHQGELTPIEAFASNAALDSGDTEAVAHEDYVQLMTIHSAKGLEFDTVFLSGMEDQLFPSQQTNYDVEKLEEERRLCYVAITRAKRQLVISHANCRQIYGQTKDHMPSRFLREIPNECIKQLSTRGKFNRPITTMQPRQASHQAVNPTLGQWKIGQFIEHPKFGQGVIINYEGRGEALQLQIKFTQQGTKWLLAKYLSQCTI